MLSRRVSEYIDYHVHLATIMSPCIGDVFPFLILYFPWLPNYRARAPVSLSACLK